MIKDIQVERPVCRQVGLCVLPQSGTGPARKHFLEYAQLLSSKYNKKEGRIGLT